VNVEDEYKTTGGSKSNLIIFFGELFKRLHGQLIIERKELSLPNPCTGLKNYLWVIVRL